MGLKNIIKSAKKGDREAQRKLYDLYKIRWYNLCLRYLPNTHDSDDAFQNGLVNIYQKMNQFDERKGAFLSWSSRVMVNECIMLLRSRKIRFVEESLETNFGLFDHAETPIERLSQQEITKIITRLPDGYRTVFNMYALEGYSHKEIAENLGISEGTSKSQLFKARKLLQSALEVLI